MKPQGILESVLYCPDLAAAQAFYTGVLGLELHSTSGDRHVFLRCGDAMLLLFNPESTSRVPVELSGKRIPLHGARGPGHLGFRTTLAEIDAWRDRLRAHGVEIESEVDWPGGGRSFYFRDPAGNSLEFVTPELWEVTG